MADGRRWLRGVQVFCALLLVWLALDGLETLAVGVLARENTLVVHAITPDPLAGVQALERRIARLFGLTVQVRP
jgi:hypothetical protein